MLTSGDTPGISKLLRLAGHNAHLPCRVCKIEGTGYEILYTVQRGSQKGQRKPRTQYYYALEKPTKSRSRKATLQEFIKQVKGIPRRTSEDYFRDGQASLKNAKCVFDSGIKGVSLLASLSTFIFPESAPFDAMHLVHLGFIPDLCEFLSGTYFKDKGLNHLENGQMMAKDWAELGSNMAAIRSPVSWGRYS